MGQQKQRNRRWVLASRPHGAPVPENFRLEEDDVATPGEGQVLLRTVYLSLDPYMRGRMSDEPSYSPPVDIGGVMVGGTVSRVVESNHPDYQPGDWVLGYSGWQDYDISSGDDLVLTNSDRLGKRQENESSGDEKSASTNENVALELTHLILSSIVVDKRTDKRIVDRVPDLRYENESREKAGLHIHKDEPEGLYCRLKREAHITAEVACRIGELISHTKLTLAVCIKHWLFFHTFSSFFKFRFLGSCF